MTSNQIRYLEYLRQSKYDSNYLQLQRASLAETQRHNLASESISIQNNIRDNETRITTANISANATISAASLRASATIAAASINAAASRYVADTNKSSAIETANIAYKGKVNTSLTGKGFDLLDQATNGFLNPKAQTQGEQLRNQSKAKISNWWNNLSNGIVNNSRTFTNSNPKKK